MKVIIFGADRLGIDFYFEIKEKEEVVAFVDNSYEKQGKEILGIEVFGAEQLMHLKYDKIYIASLRHYREIGYQIKNLGIGLDKISFLPIYHHRKFLNEMYQFQEVWRKDEFEEEWKRIGKTFKGIEIYGLPVNAVGELIPRYFMAKNTFHSDETLRIFIPDTETGSGGRICNKHLLKLLNKELHIMQEKEIAFWRYVLRVHPEDVNILEFDRFKCRGSYPKYKIKANSNNQWFTDAEIQKGEERIRRMGIKHPFVCVAARTSVYNKKTIGHDFCYDYRNTNFNDYKLALNFLQQNGITTVRMGRLEEKIEMMGNCIDYAGKYADDFNDLYLLSNCKFILTTSSGILYIATFFSKPAFVVNGLFTSFGYGGTPYTDMDLYIPRKYYDIRKERYLTLREMAKIESECLIWGERYEKKGICFIDNTAEEIAEATKEMIDRLEGKWQESAEDIENYKKYMEIYNEMEKAADNNEENWIGGAVPYRIASTYLRNNLYLLE